MKELPPYAIVLGMGNTFEVPLGGFHGWMRFEQDNWVEDHCSGKTSCMEYAAHFMSEVVTMNPKMLPATEPCGVAEPAVDHVPEPEVTLETLPIVQELNKLWTRDMPIPETPYGTVCVPEEWVTINPSAWEPGENDMTIASTKEPRDMTYKEAFNSGPEVWMNPTDPHGIHQHTPGAKNDKGKMEASLLLSFPRALWAIGEVATHGANKYSREGWQHVPEGLRRYRDAEMRHMLKGAIEELDPDSGLPHLWHKVWNAIASLELTLREQEIHEHTTTETSQEATESH